MERDFGRRAFLVGGVALSAGCVGSLSTDSRWISGEPTILERGWKHDYHDDEGESVAYANGKVFSSSKDGTIVAAHVDGEAIWKKDVHERLPKGLITTEFSRDLYAIDDAVFSAGRNGEVVSVNPEDGTEFWKHTHHDDSVWEVYVEDGIVYSSGRDAKIIAADASDGSLSWEHTAHQVDGNPSNEMIRSLYYSDGTIYSAGFDGRIIAANANDGEILWEYKFGYRIKSVRKLDKTVYYAPWSRDVYEDVIALNEDTLNRTLSHSHHDRDAEGYRGLHTGVEEINIIDDIVYSAGDDGKLVAANISDLSFLNSHNKHDGSVRSVSANKSSAFTTARDGTVIKWSFRDT